MTGSRSFGGKRELLARGLLWSGASILLSQLPAADSLLVLDYHRIGNPDDDLFDPGVFSATAEEFSDQITYLKRRVSPVTLEVPKERLVSPSRCQSHAGYAGSSDTGHRASSRIEIALSSNE
jgi:hypothetical protein